MTKHFDRPTDFARKRNVDRVSDQCAARSGICSDKRRQLKGRLYAAEGRITELERLVKEILSLRRVMVQADEPPPPPPKRK